MEIFFLEDLFADVMSERNKLGCARILIGSHLRSFEGQTYRWRHH